MQIYNMICRIYIYVNYNYYMCIPLQWYYITEKSYFLHVHFCSTRLVDIILYCLVDINLYC